MLATNPAMSILHRVLAVLGAALVFGCGSDDSAGGPAGCKRGLAYSGRSVTSPEVARLAFWYNWTAGAQTVAEGLEFVPMVWGDGFDDQEVLGGLRPDAGFLLGFNEPNFFEQANLSAAQAAALWPRLEAIADQRGLALVSPAVNFCGDDQAGTGPCHDTNPVDYLADFFAQCSGCRVDYVAVHWYNCDRESLEWYLGQFAVFGRPIWLTEFACAYGGDTSPGGQEAYMRAAVPFLESAPNVHRYAWFSADPLPNARLVGADGSLTALGEVYVNLAAATCDR
jgi:hypothetical protein